MSLWTPQAHDLQVKHIKIGQDYIFFKKRFSDSSVMFSNRKALHNTASQTIFLRNLNPNQQFKV